MTIASRGIPWRAPDTVLRLSVVSAVAAVGALVLQQVLVPSLSPLSDAISSYQMGSYAYVQASGLCALGAGSLGIAWLLRSTMRSTLVRWGTWLLTVWGLGIALLSVVNIDDGPLPTSGSFHDAIATIAFAAAVGAVVCVSYAYARGRVWCLGASMSWSASALFCGAIALLTEDSHWFGLTERALGATIVSWLIIIGTVSHRRASCAGTVDTHDPEAVPLHLP